MNDLSVHSLHAISCTIDRGKEEKTAFGCGRAPAVVTVKSQ